MRTTFQDRTALFSYQWFHSMITRYRNVTVMMQDQEENGEASVNELQNELTQNYGLVAARFCGLPESLVDCAQRLLPSIKVKTLKCDGEKRMASNR